MSISLRSNEKIISFFLIIIGLLLIVMNIYSIVGLLEFAKYAELNGIKQINTNQNILWIVAYIGLATLFIVSGFLLYFQKISG